MKITKKETDYLFQNLIQALNFNEWEMGEEKRYHEVINENHTGQPWTEDQKLSVYLDHIERYNKKYSNELFKKRKRILKEKGR